MAEVSYPARDPLLPSAKSPSPPAAGSPWPRPPLPAPAGSSPPRSRRRACPASARRFCRRRCRTVSRRDPLRAAIGGPLPASPASRSAAPARHVGGWRPSRGEGAPVLRGGVGRAASRWLPANRCLWQGMRFVRGRELGWRWREASPRTAAAPPLSAPPLPLRPSQTRRSKPVLESLPPVLRRVGAALQTPRRFSAPLGRALVPAREKRGLSPTPQPVRGTRCSSELGCVWCWQWRTDQGVLRVCQGRIVTLYYSNSCGFCVRLVSVGRMELCSYLSITL